MHMLTRRQTIFGSLVGGLGLGTRRAFAEGHLALGEALRQPPEGAVHERTFMQWPADTEIYGNVEDLDAVREKIALIANTIARFEPVTMLVRPDQADAAKGRFKAEVSLLPLPVDDLWARDSGPTFLLDDAGALAVLDFNFNGWGNKQAHANDSKIAAALAAKLGLPRVVAGVVGEAGGLVNDGAGTLLAHASSWVDAKRNSQSQDEIGNALCDALGAQTIIWAPGVSGQDITDYHIDSLARFVGPGRVVIQLPDRPDDGDPWSMAAFETYRILKSARDAIGRKLELIVMPEPVAIRSRDEDFVASYVNYYVCNGAVISAQFGDDKADAEAAKILGQLFPGREVISLNIDAIGESGGGIHCATQQQPASRAKA